MNPVFPLGPDATRPGDFDRAIAEIRRSRETQLSPVAVDAFLDVIGEFWQSRPSDLEEAA